eukprot:jgi/Mesvir1/4366/Mv02445-RA.1
MMELYVCARMHRGTLQVASGSLLLGYIVSKITSLMLERSEQQRAIMLRARAMKRIVHESVSDIVPLLQQYIAQVSCLRLPSRYWYHFDNKWKKTQLKDVENEILEDMPAPLKLEIVLLPHEDTFLRLLIAHTRSFDMGPLESIFRQGSPRGTVHLYTVRCGVVECTREAKPPPFDGENYHAEYPFQGRASFHVTGGSLGDLPAELGEDEAPRPEESERMAGHVAQVRDEVKVSTEYTGRAGPPVPGRDNPADFDYSSVDRLDTDTDNHQAPRGSHVAWVQSGSPKEDAAANSRDAGSKGGIGFCGLGKRGTSGDGNAGKGSGQSWRRYKSGPGEAGHFVPKPPHIDPTSGCEVWELSEGGLLGEAHLEALVRSFAPSRPLVPQVREHTLRARPVALYSARTRTHVAIDVVSFEDVLRVVDSLPSLSKRFVALCQEKPPK